MWKDLTLQQKAEIMRMSVANGVTDINDIQQLYDGSVGHKFNDAGRIITVGQFPEGFVNEYADTPISTPSNKSRTTLREAYNDPAWRDLHVDVNSVPYLTDYLLRQEQPNSIRPSEGPSSRTKSVATYDLWKENNPIAHNVLSFLPVTGTIMDGLELYMHPSWENAGWFATSAALDLAGAKLVGKAAKGINKADGLDDLTRLRWTAKAKGKPSYYWRGPSKSTKNVFSPEEEKMLLDAAGITGTFMTDLGTNLMQKQIEWNKEALGGHLFDEGGYLFKTGGPKKPTLGLIDRALIEGGAEGIYETTSRGRKPGQAGNKGNRSAHTKTLSDGSSAAQDIKPAKGHTWNELFAVMTSPKMQRALSKYGFDVLNETSAAMMAMTDATGEHLHVGKGIKGQQGKGQMFGGTAYGGYSVNPATGKISRTYTPSQSSSSDEVLAVKPSKDQGSPWIKFMADINTPGNISTSTKPSDIASIVATPSTDITDFSSISQEPDLAQADSQLPYDDSYNESIVNNPLWSAPYDLFEEDNILANGGHLLRRGGPYNIEARSDNTTNVVRPVIIKRDEDIKARSPRRQKLEQQKAKAREEANKITPANPRQASIGPYREKTDLDKAGGRLYAAGEQREKDKKDREAAGTAFNALLKPLLPSTYYSAYDAYKKGKVTNVWDALAAPYLTGNWADENPGEALAMDIVVPATVGKTATIANNIANRNLFSYKYIEPWHYIDKYKRAGNWAKHILLDSKPPSITETTIANKKLIDTPKFKEVYNDTKKYRDDAYRKWLGLPERTPLYVDNGDGTWSYNLRYLSDNGHKAVVVPQPYPNGNAYDTLTGNGATVGASINPNTKTVSIIDPWDVHPFSRMPDINLSEKVRNMADKAYISAGYHPISRNWFDKVAYNYLGGRALNRMRYEFKGLDNLSDLVNKYVINRMRNINGAKILGGKDFVLKQDIPYRAYRPSTIEELAERGQLNYPTASYKSNLLVDFNRVGENGLIR